MDQIYFQQKGKEKEQLYKSEKEIHNKLQESFYFDGHFKKYGLLDRSWYQKYKQYLSELTSGKRNDIFHFKFSDARIKTEEKTYCFIDENFGFNFIKNFQLITDNFQILFKENFRKFVENANLKNQKKLNIYDIFLYDIIIGGHCMICRDKNKRDIYITAYEENKANNIDFWLMINDEQQRNYHLNLILNNNLWYYLGIINLNCYDEKKDIFDDKGNNIGFFLINCDTNRINDLDLMTNKNLINNNQYQQSKDTKIINIELIPKIISVLACLSVFKEFKDELLFYSKNNKYNTVKLFVDFYTKFPNNYHYQEMKAISGLITLNASIFKTLTDIEYFINREHFEINSIEKEPKINDYDENLGKNKFLEEKKKGSIIQQLFYGIKETKVYCLECSLTSYNFEYFKFLEINLEKENNQFLLNDYIFKTKNEVKKAYCKFCNKNTDSKLEQFINEFPKILIIAFKEQKLNYYYFNKFKLSNNLTLSSNKNISYKMVCFIEVITNVVYFKENNIWKKYLGNNTYEKVESIENINPIILFYKLGKNENNDFNNISNQNIMKNNNEINNLANINNANINTNNNKNNMQNKMNNPEMNNLGKNNINMGMNNMGMKNIGMNNINMRMNNMNNIGNNNMGMNNINLMPNNMNNIGMNMNNMGMNMNKMGMNMNNMGMNMNNMGMNINNMGKNNMGMNNMRNNNINNMGNNNNNMGNNNIINMGNNNINNMGNNNIINMGMNNVGMNNINNMGNNNMNSMGMKNMGMNNMGMNNMNNMGMNNMNKMRINNMNNIGMNNMPNNNFQMEKNNGNKGNNSTDVKNPNTIFLTFTFEEYKKQIFYDVDANERFQNVINELEEKYDWLKSIKNRSFFYQNKPITNFNLSFKELNIGDNSNIIIKI